MDALRAVAALAVAALLGPDAWAAEIQCKNHYILSQPCGADWTAVNTGLPDLDVQALAIDPQDPMTLYAGVANQLYKSMDGARSWRSTALPADTWTFPPMVGGPPAGFVADHVVKLIAIDPVNFGTLRVATHPVNGCVWFQPRLFMSLNGGVTWSEAGMRDIGGCERITAFITDPNRPRQLYFSQFDYSMGDTYGPFRTSNDGGASWTISFLGPVTDVLAIDPRRPGLVYGGKPAIGLVEWDPSRNGLIVSRDDGATWSPTALSNRSVSAIAVSPVEGGAAYVATYTQESWSKPRLFEGVFRSTDGGETWLAASAGLEAIVGTATFVTALVPHPEEPDLLYAATSNAGVWRSTDAGVTWTAFNRGLESLAVRALVTTPGVPNTLYAATPLGIFAIEDRRTRLGQLGVSTRR